MKALFAVVAIAGLALAPASCSKAQPKPEAATDPGARASTPAAVAPGALGFSSAHSAKPQAAPFTPRFDGERAMKYVRDLVNFGPRPVGSPAHQKTEEYIAGRLQAASAQVTYDAFTAKTPAGPLPMRNIIGKFPGTKDGIIVIASHYDTLYDRPDFVGANDGGSSTGLLLELANQLRSARPRAGYSVWLVFFDGEEAIKNWGPSDSDYGSTHLAEQWQKDGALKKIKALILTDMIGDRDLNIDRVTDSAAWLDDLLLQAARRLGYQSYFYQRTEFVDDDHRPFLQRGVPCADLIDFNYGYNNVFWHTPQDTLDKLSPHSLQVVGDVVLEAVAMLDQK